MYNRCRRLHALLETSLHGLHLRRFIEDFSIGEDTLAALQEWVAKRARSFISTDIACNDVPYIMKIYCEGNV